MNDFSCTVMPPLKVIYTGIVMRWLLFFCTYS